MANTATPALPLGASPRPVAAVVPLRRKPHGRAGTWDHVRLLDEDEGLAAALAPQERVGLADLLRAPAVSITRWPPELPFPPTACAYGLLVLDGLIGRRVKLGAEAATELLGQGDVLRPWHAEDSGAPATAEVEWRVFLPARLALLDERVTSLIGRHPKLLIELTARSFRRTHAAAYLSAASHVPRVEDRLLSALAHIAARWGRVTTAGVRIPFRLTHETLGEIVGARRPTVSIGVRQLRERGELTRNLVGEYVLTGGSTISGATPLRAP